MIDQQWLTDRLKVSDSVPVELTKLQRVQESNSGTFRLEGRQPEPGELQRWLMEGDLPPDGLKERYRLQTISRRDNEEVIGCLSLYHGFPDPETVYIACLFIRQDYQGRGFGGEVVGGMADLNGLRDFPTHRLVVTVRNWGAVRFWVRHGFTRVVNVIGNFELEEGASARLELVRECGV